MASHGHPLNGLSGVQPNSPIRGPSNQPFGSLVPATSTCFAVPPAAGLAALIHPMMAVHGQPFGVSLFHITIAAWMSARCRMVVLFCAVTPSRVVPGQTAPRLASLFRTTMAKHLQRSVTSRQSRRPSSAIRPSKPVDQIRSRPSTHGSVGESSGRM